MTDLTRHPLVVFVASLLVLSLSAWLGRFFAIRRRTTGTGADSSFEVVEAATLTMLGLIIGFTFSMALGRYDQRKKCEEEEANAIGTEYLRVGLLPTADAARAKGLILSYLGQRILFYETSDKRQLIQVNAQTAKLQAELWAAVEAPAVARPDPVRALAVAGMNDVLNTQGYTQAAWWNRIPVSAWSLMAAIAIFSNLLVGLGAGTDKSKHLIHLVLPLVISVAFLLIADLDSPRGGLIRVLPQNLEALSQSLNAPIGNP